MESYIHIITSISSVYLLLLVALFIFFLTKGADIAIDGAVDLARALNLSPLVIGATVVSVGTTLPEAFVSVMAAWSNNPGLALGNGVGSIIVDTGLILGGSCLFFNVPIDRFILNRTGWVQVLSATFLVIIALVQKYVFHRPILDRWVGVLFMALLIFYLYLTYKWSKKSSFIQTKQENATSHIKASLKVVIGLFFVVVSSKLLIISAQELARRLGVPEDVIAATMVAFGTSLPEFMTAITAAKKGHPEIMVGNIVGADVLNCLFVIGASALATPLSIPQNFFHLHFPAMILILYSFRIFISINKHKKSFPRWQGGFLILIYLAYVLIQYK
ncbi:calcium/sodium antiporter [Desulfothermus okinawensis JCM 13304]